MKKIELLIEMKRSDIEDQFVGKGVLVDTEQRISFHISCGNPKNKKIEIGFSNEKEKFSVNGLPSEKIFTNLTNHQLAIFAKLLPRVYDVINHVKVTSYAKTQILRKISGDNIICENKWKIEVNDDVYKLLFQ